MPGEQSWATGKEISLYVGTVLMYQACPHPDPQGSAGLGLSSFL